MDSIYRENRQQNHASRLGLAASKSLFPSRSKFQEDATESPAAPILNYNSKLQVDLTNIPVQNPEQSRNLPRKSNILQNKQLQTLAHTQSTSIYPSSRKQISFWEL